MYPERGGLRHPAPWHPCAAPFPRAEKKTEYLDDRIPRPAAQPLHAMPVTGRIVRDNARSPDSIRYALAALMTALVTAVKTRGPVALAPRSLAVMPVMVVLPVAITRG